MPSEIFPIILNSTNVVPGDLNTYVYKFPRNSINLKNASICLHTINLYYSWSNVDVALYNNNKFQVFFPDSTGGTNYDVVLPDGNYEVSDINAYMQKVFIDNGLYHINNTTGQYRYYMELKINPITYSVDNVSANVPTSTPTGYSDPPGGFAPGKGYPVAPEPTFINILSNNFGKLIGFTNGLHADHSSDFTPQIAEVSSVFVRCSLVNNKFTNPPDIIYAFTAGGKKFGEMLSIENQNLIFSSVPDGMYSEVKITLTDQEYRKLNIKDTNLIIYLVLQIQDQNVKAN